MFSLLAHRNAPSAQRHRAARTRLSLEQLDRRQVLSAAPWAIDTAGPVAAASPAPSTAMSIPQFFGTAGVAALPVSSALQSALTVGDRLAAPAGDVIGQSRGLANPDLAIDVAKDGTVRATATIIAPTAGPLPFTWGTPSRSGNVVTIAIDMAADRGGNGLRAQVITPHRHEYLLGTFQDGTYQLKVTTGGHTVLSREFVVGTGRSVTILPVGGWKPQTPAALPVSDKPSVAPQASPSHTVRVVSAVPAKVRDNEPVLIPAAAAAHGFKVGMSVEAAKKTGVSFRTVEVDGKPLVTTMDFRPGRLNVAVKGGVIVRIVSIG